jgi:hypothetical protein
VLHHFRLINYKVGCLARVCGVARVHGQINLCPGVTSPVASLGQLSEGTTLAAALHGM